MIIKLPKNTEEFIKSNSTLLVDDKMYMHIPFWFMPTDKKGVYEFKHLHELPENIKNIIYDIWGVKNSVEFREKNIIRQGLMYNDKYKLCCPNCADLPILNKDINQFMCNCGWVSEFQDDFIKRYIDKWQK